MNAKLSPVALLTLAVLVAWGLPLHAQTYSWVRRTGGDPAGTYADGATADFSWGWNPGGQSLTGHFTRTRVGAGTTSAGSESAAATILARRSAAPEFDHSPLAVSVGGVNGIYHFVNGGDTQPPAGTAAPGRSTTVATLTFDGAASSPANTLIELFDAGSSVNGVDGPFTCAFAASLHGLPVDTTQWTLDVEYPYAPATGAATTGITWDGRTVTVPHYLNGALSGGNFPDTLVFLNTRATTFDTLTVTAASLDVDSFALGFGANAAPDGAVPAGTLQFGNAAYYVAEDAGNATVAVRRVDGGAGPVAVSYATSGGTATDGLDYTGVAGTLSWADGDTTDKTISVPVLNRALETGDAVSVTLALDTPTGGAALGNVSHASLVIAQTTTPPAPVLSLASPPDGLVVEAGSPLPLAASADDPGGRLVRLQFQIDGQPVGPAATGASAVQDATAPTTPGSHQVAVVGTDGRGQPYTAAHALSVVPVNLSNPAAHLSILSGLDGHDVAPGSFIDLDAGGAVDPANLQRVDFYANGVRFASLDGAGNPVGLDAAPAGRPTRRDAANPSGTAALLGVRFQMPGSDKVASMISVALDRLGHSTVSKPLNVHARSTTDRAPRISLSGLNNAAHLKVGSNNAVSIQASDPDAPSSQAATGVHRDAAPDNAVLSLLEYFINGKSIGRAMTTSTFTFNFSPPSSGKYVLAAQATDDAGLSAVSDPVVVVADGAPETVNFSITGTGVAVVGGAKASVTITRAGGGGTDAPLTVSYKANGTAKAGVDYKKLSGTVTIPTGATKAKIKIKPIAQSSGGGGARKVKLTLLPSADERYEVGAAYRASIKIVDP